MLRRRLLDQLDERFRNRITLIEADAGFGKSTLLRQMLDTGSASHGAVRVAGPDGFDAAVTVPRSGFDRDQLVAALLDAVATATGRTRGSSADLVDVVWAVSPERVCLVIDDAHWLSDDAAELVTTLEAVLPANGHLLVSMRPDPGSRFVRLLALPSSRRIDSSDLAFDHDERLAFGALRGTSSVDPSGWPALLELESRTGRTGALRYVISEVVESLPADTVEDCRRLATLPWVDDRLASALLGRSVSAERVFADLPLTRISGGRVEVHDLLREALLLDWPDASHRQALVAASAAARDLGDLDLAVDCSAKADDRDGAALVARMLARELHFESSSQQRRATIARLRTVLGSSLEVDVVEAVNATMDEPGRASGPLAAALERAVSDHDNELESLCRLRLADVAYNAADLDALTEQAAELDRLAGVGEPWARRTAFLAHVWILSLSNRPADVVPYLDAIRAGLVPGADPEVEEVMAMYRVWNLAYTGNIRTALEQLRDEPPPRSGLFANRLGGFMLLQRWFLGELTADERRSVSDLVDLIGQSGQVHLFVEGASSVSLFHASAGDAAQAEAFLRRAETVTHRLAPTAWAHHTVAQARAALLVLQGDESAAIDVLTAAIPSGGITSLPRFIYGATATLSYVLVPSAREVWEADRPGPDHVLRREVGRALVALRERGDTGPARMLPWGDVDALRTWALEPHLAELAVAAIDAGCSPAGAALDTLVHDPHRVLVDLAAGGPADLRPRFAALASSRPRRPVDGVEILALGSLELRRGGRPVDDDAWTRRQRVRDLLALLVERRSIDRVQAAEIMWPDKSADAASGNLRFTLSQLIGVLEPDREASHPSWFIRSVGNSLELGGRDLLTVDVDEFERLLGLAEAAERSGRPTDAVDAYQAAVDLYRGDYLTGSSDRELGYYAAMRWRGRFVTAAARAAEMLLAVGEVARAETLALRAVAAEPMHEAAQRTLAEVLLAQHRLGAARSVLGDLVVGLNEAGLPPEPRTVTVLRRLGIGNIPDGV